MSDTPPAGQPAPQPEQSSAPANPTAGALLVATAPAVDASEPLLWRPLHRKTLASWSLRALAEYTVPRSTATPEKPLPRITRIVILARGEREAEAKALAAMLHFPSPAEPLTRVVLSAPDWRSALTAGLAALPDECQWVIVHDAARPLISGADLAKGFWAALAVGGGALAGEPVNDTLKRVWDGQVVETPPRANLRRLMPPLIIRREPLARALQAPDAAGLAAIARASGARVAVYAYASSDPNPVVASPADWDIAEEYFRRWVHYPFSSQEEGASEPGG